MARTRIFRVTGGRMQFKCPSCQSKKMVSVPPKLRRRSVRCHKCSETTNCSLNRRALRRSMQSGRVQMIRLDGREFEVDIHDISDAGIGVETSIRDSLKISPGQRFKFRCGWNPRLIAACYYEVRSVKEQHIGLKKMT